MRSNLFILTSAIAFSSIVSAQVPKSAEVWLTNPDKSQLFAKQAEIAFKSKSLSAAIEINESQTFQEIDGFGYCLTGGSATLISKMQPAEADKLLKDLYAIEPHLRTGTQWCDWQRWQDALAFA